MLCGIVGASKVNHCYPFNFRTHCQPHHIAPGLIGAHDHAVGSQFTLADILIFNAFGDVLSSQENPDLPPHIREPFGSLSRTQDLLKAHPKVTSHAPFEAEAFGHHAASLQLERIVLNVRSHPGIQLWLQRRGPQEF
jgi:hypothetical protein